MQIPQHPAKPAPRIPARRRTVARPAWIAGSLALGLLALAGFGSALTHSAVPAEGEASAAATPGQPLSNPLVGQLLSGPSVGFDRKAAPWLSALSTMADSAQEKTVAELNHALAPGAPEWSTRAAVLLGAILASDQNAASARSSAQAALLARIERRIDPGARWSVGTDVAAARALDRPVGSAETIARIRAALLVIATGPSPHPYLAVRVECAATVLALVEPTDRSGPAAVSISSFLLAVLRAETPAQDLSPRTWPRLLTLAWVKTRAGRTLSQWVGTDMRFRPDGSWAHQVEEAARLESLLP